MGIAKIKPTQPQLWLARAWAELGNFLIFIENFKIILRKSGKAFLENHVRIS